MESRSFQAIIFDFNGVLVDDEPLHRELLGRVLTAEGMHFLPEEYPHKYLGLDDRRCFERALREHNRLEEALDPARIEQLIGQKAASYREVLLAAPPGAYLFPGIASLVSSLSKQLPLAIVSGALREEIELSIDRAGLGGYFRLIIAAEDVDESKPNPEGYRRGLDGLQQQLGPLDPAECLAIEDSVAGVAAARAAGLRCLAVTTSYPAHALSAADWITPHLPEWFLTRPA
jgi:HAD superfamily hydrolase (TIGR01509 family)